LVAKKHHLHIVTALAEKLSALLTKEFLEKNS
jgi:hypothetical protein